MDLIKKPVAGLLQLVDCVVSTKPLELDRHKRRASIAAERMAFRPVRIIASV